MKRSLSFVSAILLFGAISYGQQSNPATSPPAEPEAPVAVPSRSVSPAQAVVPVPVPIAPPKPNGPVRKSLVRVTATSVEPDYKGPLNAGALQRRVGAAVRIRGDPVW